MKKVLFIEDDWLLSQTVTLGLREFGFDVLCKDSFVEIETLLKAYQPHVILLDLQIYDDDSRCLLPIFRHYSPQSPIIVASSNTDDEVIGDCYNHHISSFIKKPYGLMELRAVIDRVLEPATDPEIELAQCTLNCSKHKFVDSAGCCHSLNPKDCQLLSILMKLPHHRFSSEELMNCIWGSTVYRDSLNNSISRLRQLLKQEPNIKIRTHWREGYELIVSTDLTDCP